MMRTATNVLRRIPAIIMIQNSETDSAAYLGHFQKSLLNTNLRLVHFKMFNEEHLRLLPQCVKAETWQNTPHFCTHTSPSSLSPSLSGSPQLRPNDSGSASPKQPLTLPSCVMTPCDASSEDKIDYHVVGIVSLGGPMSAADDASYPFIKKVMTLMRSAVEEDVPVLGICLGSQMLSRALGGEVTEAPIGEMGFVPQHVEADASFATPAEAAAAKAKGFFNWFAGRRELLSYHWHGDTFSIPPGAVRVTRGEYCANQAFQVPFKYVLGVQWHPDIDDGKAQKWLLTDGIDQKEPSEPLTPGLVTCGEFLTALADGSQMKETQALADDIYKQWFEGVYLCKDRRVELLGSPSHVGRDEDLSPFMSPRLQSQSSCGFADAC